MTGSDFQAAIHALRVRAGMNYCYHQALTWRWGTADLWARIFTVVFAFADLAMNLAGSGSKTLSALVFLALISTVPN
jgi:hypothetical protein